MNTKEKKLKEKIIHEMRLFAIYATFFTFFFCSLILYQNLILSQYSISYLHYGFGVLEALILAKIILLGESFGLAEKYADQPLIIPTLYKSVIFSLFVLVFTLLEHFMIGFLHGDDSAKIYQELMNKGKDVILAKIQIVFFVFILFFAFSETSRVLGESKLINLFLHRRSKDNF